MDTRKQQGVVLTFKEYISQEEAERILDAIKRHLDHEPKVRSFNPNHGGPVWYIP
jgi:hypothetical protein